MPLSGSNARLGGQDASAHGQFPVRRTLCEANRPARRRQLVAPKGKGRPSIGAAFRLTLSLALSLTLTANSNANSIASCSTYAIPNTDRLRYTVNLNLSNVESMNA